MALETIYACGSAPRPTCLIFLATSSPIRRRSRTNLVGERGAKGRGIEGRDVSACRSGLFILSPADTPAMILTRRGEAFSPKEKKRRRDGRGGVRKRERYVTREAEEVAESFFFHAFRGKCV